MLTIPWYSLGWLDAGVHALNYYTMFHLHAGLNGGGKYWKLDLTESFFFFNVLFVAILYHYSLTYFLEIYLGSN